MSRFLFSFSQALSTANIIIDRPQSQQHIFIAKDKSNNLHKAHG